jgi:hypothetical protein
MASDDGNGRGKRVHAGHYLHDRLTDAWEALAQRGRVAVESEFSRRKSYEVVSVPDAVVERMKFVGHAAGDTRCSGRAVRRGLRVAVTQSAKEPGIRAASTVADRVTETTRLTGIDMAAVSRAVARAWSLPPRRNRVTVVRGVAVPMSDGTVLWADPLGRRNRSVTDRHSLAHSPVASRRVLGRQASRNSSWTRKVEAPSRCRGGDRGRARTSAPSDQMRGPDTRMVHR